MPDIIVTWPKTRPLRSYLGEVKRARAAGEVIGYRVGSHERPVPNVEPGERCYMVWDGAVRGYLTVLGVDRTGIYTDPVTGEEMAPGAYVVRRPVWHHIDPIPFTGFRGWRYAPIDWREEIGTAEAHGVAA